MKELKFRELRADEIDCRVGTISDKGFSLLLYKDARCDQNILDETVGAMNWQKHYEIIGGELFCTISIWDEEKNQWISKQDVGVESNTEAEKGRASDAQKRAAFAFGIGRSLYTAPFIWIKGNVEKNTKGNLVPTYKSIKVVEIKYNEGRISALKISGDGETIYTYGQAQSQDKPAQANKQSVKSDELTLDEALTFKTTKGTLYADLPDENLQWIVENVTNARMKRAAELIIEDRAKVTADLLELDDTLKGEEGLPF